MARAGIFIGVDRTGTLDTLKDAAAGAARMRDWAVRSGGIPEANARLITDADNGKVTPEQIFDEVDSFISRGPGVDQLILYFAGHGVNINRSEHWLLSDAPRRTSAAVNVRGSVELARYCGIPHVAIFSDACRVAPAGIQAQNVQGVDIFPNDGAGDRAKPVDQFFACVLGKTAAEIQDPKAAAGTYTALYTEELIATLRGDRSTALEPSTQAGESARYVRPRGLQTHLESAIPQLVSARGLAAKVNQSPDAIITSDNLWLARLDGTSDPPRMGGGRPRPPTDGPQAPSTSVPVRVSLRGFSRDLLRSAVAGNRDRFDRDLNAAIAAPRTGASQLARAVETIATPFGPDHFETMCGFKIRGARLIEAFAPGASVEKFDDAELVRVHGVDGAAASVLLRFEGDMGTVLPALPGFVTALTFEERELVDVTYEPSANSGRWDMYKDRLEEIRRLRAVAASASQYGRFRLDGEQAQATAEQMQYVKSLDPTLAIYAAYAYHDLLLTDRIAHMSQWLRGDLGVTFFDLLLLSRQLVGKAVTPADGVVPFTPLLSQGWALINANRVKLHPRLEGLQAHVLESLWSLYDGKGLDRLAAAMQTKEVR